MKILFVVPHVPSRLRGRAFNFIRRLSGQHEVAVLCVATNDSDYQAVAELKRYCQAVEVFEVPLWRSFWNCLVGVFSSNALRSAYFYSPCLRQRLTQKVGLGEADLVHAEHLKSVAMVEDVAGRVPIVFDSVDCSSMFEARRTKVIRDPLLKLFFWTEGKKMGRTEARTAKRFDRVVISSAVDRGCYPVSPQEREGIRVVPNGVDLEYFHFQQYEAQRDAVVLCANLAYFPNEDAALYFARSVWPGLLARRPNLRLEIVGSKPPRSVRRLDGKDNIRVIASVPDVRPYLGRAWVALCPVRVQAGTQFKILEAMALGIPVVATRICCPGLGVEPGKHLLAADTPEEFASAVELLLDNPTLRANMIQAGRKYVEQQQNWDHSVEKLLAAYAEALATRDRDAVVRH
jgi:sugar transferase (PEP-CTERM/EpsH1 system associated)